MNQEMLTKAEAIVEENSVYRGEIDFGMCTLSLIDRQGYPTSSVITPSKSEGLRWLTFGTMLNENRAKRIALCNKASVCFSSSEYCINLVGDIEITTDAAIKQEMWYEGLSHHFTGPDEPNYCVLKFTTKRYKLFLDFQEIEGTL